MAGHLVKGGRVLIKDLQAYAALLAWVSNPGFNGLRKWRTLHWRCKNASKKRRLADKEKHSMLKATRKM